MLPAERTTGNSICNYFGNDSKKCLWPMFESKFYINDDTQSSTMVIIDDIDLSMTNRYLPDPFLFSQHCRLHLPTSLSTRRQLTSRMEVKCWMCSKLWLLRSNIEPAPCHHAPSTSRMKILITPWRVKKPWRKETPSLLEDLPNPVTQLEVDFHCAWGDTLLPSSAN